MQSIVQWIRRAKLKDWLRLIDRIIPHVAIVLSGMLAVFFLIDRVNKPMAFMTNEFHKRITFVLALMAIYLAVRRLSFLRARERETARRPRQSVQRTQRRTGEPARAADGYEARRSASVRRTADYAPSSRSDASRRY